MPKARRRNRNSVRYQQYQGGYARVAAAQLQGLLEGYRRGVFRRNEVRVFAGRWEHQALHSDSLVTLYRVINCRSHQKGNRRLSHAAIAAAAAKLDKHLPGLQSTFEQGDGHKTELKPVARRVLCHVARGGATTVEALMCFAYFLRRVPQRRPLQRLKADEHYARFRYAEFEAWTGVRRETQSRVIVRLMERGFINKLPVHKQNENVYGSLFIDGESLSLVRRGQTPRRRYKHAKPRPKKTSTRLADSVNSPPQKTSTLRNINPKTEIEERDGRIERLERGALAHHGDSDLRRIAWRAVQMEQQRHLQAA